MKFLVLYLSVVFSLLFLSCGSDSSKSDDKPDASVTADETTSDADIYDLESDEAEPDKSTQDEKDSVETDPQPDDTDNAITETDPADNDDLSDADTVELQNDYPQEVQDEETNETEPEIVANGSLYWKGDESFPVLSPFSCQFQNADCGEVSAEDGSAVACGTCSENDVCGGGGRPNKCGHKLCDSGFCMENPYPQANNLYGVFRRGDELIAAGESMIVQYDGNRWNQFSYQLRMGGTIRDIYIGENESWAVATDGSILKRMDSHFDNRKELDEDGFPIYHSPVKWSIYDIWGTADNNIWACGYHGFLHYDGTEWIHHTEVGEPDTDVDSPPYTLFGTSKDNIWAGARRAFYHYNGTGWKEHSKIEGTIHNLWGNAQDNLWAVGENSDGTGLVMHFDGSEWAVVEKEISAPLYAVGGLSSDRIWFAGEKGGLYLFNGKDIITMAPIFGSHTIRDFEVSNSRIDLTGDRGISGYFDGRMWHLNKVVIPAPVEAVYGSAPHDIWAGGKGYIMHYNGSYWEIMPVFNHVKELFGDSYNNIYGLDNNDMLFHYNGNIWLYDSDTELSNLTSMRQANSSRITIDKNSISYTVESVTWSFGNDGKRFIKTESDSTRETALWPFDGLRTMPRGSWGTDRDDVWAVSDDGIIHYDGNSWKKFYTDYNIRCVNGVASDDVYFGTFSGSLLHWDGDNLSTITLDLPAPVSAIAFSSEGTIYLASDKLYTLEGENAKAVETGITFPSPAKTLIVTDDIIYCGGTNFLVTNASGSFVLEKPENLIERGLAGKDTLVDIRKFFALDKNNVWFIGKGNSPMPTNYVFYFDGEKWQNSALSRWGESDFSFTDLWATDPSDLYITTSDSGYMPNFYIAAFPRAIEPTGSPLGAYFGIKGDFSRLFGPYGVILFEDMAQ